ncbi:MAG TPA: squalene synthase HpnC [Nocardioidaceae bacterium]|nr:squalene synthase HpnC [Nocardioidaceae bacterium]
MPVRRPAGGSAHAATENFPVALRILPRRTRHHLLAVYNYARYVDDLGDEFRGDRVQALDQVAAEVRRLYRGRAPDDPVVAALGDTVRATHLPAQPLLRLIEANLQDQRVQHYETFDQLLDYCRLSANPVGEIVLHVFGSASDDRVELSDRICTALQLLEHWQDVGEDYGNGRSYLPAEDLRRFGVRRDDLGRRRATPGLQALLSFETDRALAWLNAGSPLVSSLQGWARLAVSGYVAGGRAAAAQLAVHGYDPLEKAPKPRGRHIAREWLWAAVRRPG